MPAKTWIIYASTFLTRRVDCETAVSFEVKPTGDLILLGENGTPLKAYAAGKWERVVEHTPQAYAAAKAWYDSFI